ncbi:MAG: hypothetical protein KGI25_09240, partial [Thaumarchaeota archaeon]|nr:hypothetical protein [Nitrososphaerota archaeon]
MTTSLSIANADSMIWTPYDKKELQAKTQFVENKGDSNKKTFSVNLSENIGVADTKSSSVQLQNAEIEISSPKAIQVSLSEKISLTVDDQNQNLVSIVKQNSEIQTTFDRIWNFDRIRISEKGITRDIAWNHQSNEINLFNFMESQELSFVKTVASLENNFKKSTYEQLIGNVEKNISLPHPQNAKIISENIISQNGFWEFVHDTISPNDPVIFLILVPFSAYLLVKSENDEIRIYNSRKILSLFFMFIIISSVVATPVSLSPSFIAAAYAAESNQTVDTTVNSTANNNGTGHLSFNQFSNSTETNSTLSFNNFSNATSVKSNSTLSFNNFSNATS